MVDKPHYLCYNIKPKKKKDSKKDYGIIFYNDFQKNQVLLHNVDYYFII